MNPNNPFADFDPEGSVWEEGFQAGFQQPDVTSQPPLSPNLIEVYLQGQQSGRDARRNPPQNGGTWIEVRDVLFEQGADQAVDWTVEKILEPVLGAFAGMISVLKTVMSVPGDVQLGPLPENFNRLLGQNDTEDDPRYVAICLRTDHAEVSTGVTSQGTWGGQEHTDFTDAIVDLKNHAHPEAFVARCSLRNNTCGVVWAAKPGV